MIKVRMARAGTKKVPFYRVVVTDHRNPRDGSHLENIGTWDPRAGEGKFTLKHERYKHWLGVGAQPSELVASLIKRFPATPAP